MIRNITKRQALLAMCSLPLAALCTSTAFAQAQPWPSKTVRIVVPFAVGGTADLLARIVGEALQKSTGQTVVVDSKPGAGGAIAATDVARAPADGHTLILATSSTHSVAPAVRKELPYNAIEDFTPIALLANANNLLLVSPTLNVRNLSELIALARQKPGFLNYTTGGIGTHSHLAFELLKARAGVDMTHVPYKGTGASITDLVSGQVHLTWDSLPTGLPHVKAARVLGVAVSGQNRSPVAPDIPTVGETVKGFAVTTWYGLYAPRGMPPELALRINQEVNKVLHTPAMVARFSSTLGVEPAKTSPPELAAVAAAERDRWAALVRERNIKME